MSKTRNLSDLLDANGDVKSTALDNVPPSNDASALTTGTLDNARLATNVSVSGNLSADGINATGTVSIENSSGYGKIEMGGSSGAVIDLKTPFSDDYDARIICDGTDLTLQGAAGVPIKLTYGAPTRLETTSTGVDVTGTVTATAFSGDGSGLTGVGGITNSDSWVLTSNLSPFPSPYNITSNLARYTQDGVGYLGTGMTQSSGIFTFPSTGIWLITAQGYFFRTSTAEPFFGLHINTTTNNSTYSVASQIYNSFANSSGFHCSTYTSFIFDVQDTSTHKVRFSISSSGNNSVSGTASEKSTGFEFIRLGDT